MSTTPTCPYCNTPLSAESVVQEAGKPRCPRCGEPLPAGLIAALPSTPADVSPSDPAYRKPVEANRRVILLILAGMSAIAACALIFALMTRDQRRARDPKMLEPAPQPPGELTAFRYLPRTTNLALGLHVADILNDPDASTLLKKPRPAALDWTLDLIRTRTSIDLNDLDHVLLGTTLETKLPMLVLVVQTRKPYSLTEVKKAMRPAAATTHLGQPLFRFSTPPMGEAFLWCRTPRTLLFLWRPESVDKKDLDLIPRGDTVGEEAIPLPLRGFITTRLEKQSLLWLVGDLESLPRLQAALDPFRAALPGLKAIPRIPEPWDRLRFAGLSIVNETGKEAPSTLTLRGQFQTPDEETAKQVESRLSTVKVPGQVKNTVTGPPPEATEPEDMWVLWQLRLEVDAMRQWLGDKK